MRHEPCCGALEKYTRPVGAGPAQGVEPPRQTKGDQRFREFDVAIGSADFRCVLPALLAGAVGVCLVQRLDAQLLGQRPQHGLRHCQRVFQKRAQVAHRRELDGEAQPIMRTALRCDQRMIGIVQVKIPGEVVG